MRQIKGMEMEELRVEYSDIIKDKSTTEEELVMMFDFFREHMYVVDNEIKKRAWVDYQKRMTNDERNFIKSGTGDEWPVEEKKP